MADWRGRLLDDPARDQKSDGRAGFVIRRLPPPIWETVPALVVPAPMFVLSERAGLPSFTPPEFAYTLLTLDVDYIKHELFPMLAQRHFRKAGDASEYQVAVVDSGNSGALVYQSTTEYPTEHRGSRRRVRRALPGSHAGLRRASPRRCAASPPSAPPPNASSRSSVTNSAAAG